MSYVSYVYYVCRILEVELIALYEYHMSYAEAAWPSQIINLGQSANTTSLSHKTSVSSTMDDNKPYLVGSTTEDDDSAVTHTNDQPLVNRQAIAYLLRYETMVRQQEAEHMATLAHLRPLLESLSERQLISTLVDSDLNLEKEISFQQLKDALDTIEHSSHSYMKTDLQLMMALKTMVVKNTEEENGSITWAEFMQCYKTIVAGMQTLQHIHEPNCRARAKDRTLSMISLFEPPATKLLDSLPRDIDFRITGEEKVGMSKEAERGMSSRLKKLAYLLLGVIIGATLVFTVGVHSKTVSSAPDTLTIPVPVKPRQPVCPETVVVHEVQSPIFAQPVRSAAFAKPMPRLIATKNVVGKTTNRKEEVRKVQPVEVETKKSKNRVAVSASVGGVAGLLVAPVVWNALQKLPSLMTAIPGWGVAAFVGSVVVQGIIQSLVLRHVNRKQE